MEVIDTYIVELQEDLKIDNTILEEKTMLVPGIKGKWLGRLIKHKREARKYEVLLEEAKNKLVKEMEKNSEIAYNKATLEKMALDNNIAKKIKANLDAERLAAEFCERSLPIVSSMSFDIKNILEGYKLELT